MELVVNTNRIIAALVKDSISRKIIYSTKFQFFTIEFGLKEVEKYKSLIKEKTGLNEEQFNDLMRKITANITVFTEKEISIKALSKSTRIMGKIDPKDIPFLALSIELGNKSIWSDDKHFLEQKEVKVFSTKELAKTL